MPRKKELNLTKLLKAIESGKVSTSLREEFGFNNLGQLKAAYLDALVDRGSVQPIKTVRRRGKTSEVKNEVTVNKRGSIIIHKDIVEKMGFKVGDILSVRKTRAGISLKQQ